MASQHDESVLKDSQISPALASNPASTQEKGSPASSPELRTHGGSEANEKDLKYGPAIDEWGSRTEAVQSSIIGGSEALPSRGRRQFTTFRMVLYLFIWLVMTGWWIAGLVLHRYDLGWLIPFLLWLSLTIRLVTFYVSTKYVTKMIASIWMHAINKPIGRIPEQFRLLLGATGTIAVIVAGTFGSPESADNTRANRAVSLFGLLVFICGFYATSRDRKNIIWQTVIVGILAQFLLALFVLRTKAGYDIFNFIAFLAKSLLSYAADGAEFLTSASALKQGWFIVIVIPPIIFFVSFVQLLYYWGWLQWAIRKFATVFFYTNARLGR